ncbi:CobW family GTP-binding protein [Tateyamaria sp. SN6-1]|uniref:CobW family GTP-binding protein n=1 Tax=Tateyamaria sp. SN6-1 TaxID=3092148 RepID=UPI0039F49C3A
MTAAIPVTIIGGYLGAGKTTLINAMLRAANGVKLAVLVNEFGELPIDEDLIEAQDDALISIAGGCICCSFGSDLSAAMVKLAEMSPAPDHIVIETSGVALPGAITHTLSILSGFSVDGICVLADCAHARAQAQDDYIGDTITRQFSDANLLLLTKSDLVSDAVLADMQAWLRTTWPAPGQVVVRDGKVPLSILLGRFDEAVANSVTGHHDAAYDSVFLDPSGPVDVQALVTELTRPAHNILRAKGFVRDHDGHTRLIQIVGPRADVSVADTHAAPGLVCIGRSGLLARSAIASLVQ